MVQIENSSFEYVLNRYDRENTFFYLDPPYPFTGERGSAKVYDHEMTDEAHNKLVSILLGIKRYCERPGKSLRALRPRKTSS